MVKKMHILKFLKERKIEQISFKYSFEGGYSLKPIKNGFCIYPFSFNVFEDEIKELFEVLNIKDDFEILKIYGVVL